jgi:hypothetical protein
MRMQNGWLRAGRQPRWSDIQLEEALANFKETTELYLSEFPQPRRKPALRSTF